MSPEELLKQAQSFQLAGRLPEATIAFEKLRSLYPQFPPILNDLGTLYLQQGKLKEGRRLFLQSLDIDPKQPTTIYNLARSYEDQGEMLEASTIYNEAVKVQPNFIDAHLKKGMCLHYLERFDDAIECFDNVIKIDPNSAVAHNGRGIGLYHAGQYQDALISLNKAKLLNEQSPEICNNLGLALHKLNRFQEALNQFDQSIALNPRYADAYSNRGLTFQALQMPTEALNNFNWCLEIYPNEPYAQWNKALIKILLGDYEEGWALYEWRWQAYSKKWLRNFKQPLWLGQAPLKNKTILIYPEQGLGDFIQFCRYIPKLIELGAKVILEAPGPLVTLASSLLGDIQILESGKSYPYFDYQCPIMSLPHAFKTNLNNIPSELPYLFANAGKIKQWEKILGPKDRPRVGIAWSGAKGQANDHNRSMRLENLFPLLAMPFEFHSLQKDVRPDDELVLIQQKILDHRGDLENFSDTAALIQNMDIVVSVDTSIAHLAGSLNKKMFVLLAFNADYRWLMSREDSPWYPNAILIRQDQIGQWELPIQELVRKIELITFKS